MISELDIIKILRETNALMKGHFILSSGLHSAEYLQFQTNNVSKKT